MMKWNRTGKLLLLFMVWAAVLYAQNPITPPGMYTADPSARVWEDGRIHVYVSRDEVTTRYCSWDYPVLFSDDLIRWNVEKNAFAARGASDRVPYSDALLFAPDCMKKGDTYYFYYCLSEGAEDEGVALSRSPAGPFTDARPIKGISQIDPCCFVDDDGRSYLIWGQFACKMARLDPGMTSVDTASVRIIATEKDHHFHEAAWMTKRHGIYYLVFADISRRNTPTCLGYATASSPFGPFTYQGVIIDNTGSDPLVWNNHGSIVEFHNRWYVFYHRSTHASRMMRKTCIEPIQFTADGRIPEVEMTSQGAAPPLDAFSIVEAERACLLSGSVRIRFDETIHGEELAEMENGNTAAYKYIDFGEGITSVAVRAFSQTSAGNLVFRLDRPWGPVIASVQVPAANGTIWHVLSDDVTKNIQGIHVVWVECIGDEQTSLEIDWFRFKKQGTL